MKKIIALIIILGGLFSLFYFDLPFNLLKPVFHKDIIDRYAATYDFDPLFLSALIKAESKFFSRARSHRGAVGLMQLMPATAAELYRELGYKNFSAGSLEDPRLNIELGTYYLSKLKKEFFGSDVLALAAYNAGKSKVLVWYRQNPLIETEIDDIPYEETRNYVKEVVKTYKWLKLVKEFKNLIRGRIAA